MKASTRRPAPKALSSIPSPAAAPTGVGCPSMQTRNVVFVNTNNVMHLVTLIPAKDIDAMRKAHPHEEISRNRGAPFGMWRRTLLSPWGLPCNPPPWGKLHAVDMREWKNSLVGAAGHHRRPGAFQPIYSGQDRHTQSGRSHFHRRRLGLHRRGNGQLSARLRCQKRHGIVERPVAGGRPGHAHDLYVEGQAVCRHCRRRP